jgi:hypothetical protein
LGTGFNINKGLWVYGTSRIWRFTPTQFFCVKCPILEVPLTHKFLFILKHAPTIFYWFNKYEKKYWIYLFLKIYHVKWAKTYFFQKDSFWTHEFEVYFNNITPKLLEIGTWNLREHSRPVWARKLNFEKMFTNPCVLSGLF